jgi:osmotically-inducible protein OsmY
MLGALVAVGGAVSGCTSTATRESAGEYFDGSVTTAKVKAALIGEPTLNGLEISVETFKDRVLLSGFVDSAAQKERATAVAYGVDGVTNVENKLIVK